MPHCSSLSCALVANNHMFSKTDGKCFVSKTKVKNILSNTSGSFHFPTLALHEALLLMPQNFIGTEKDPRLRSEATLSKHIHEMCLLRVARFSFSRNEHQPCPIGTTETWSSKREGSGRASASSCSPSQRQLMISS